jgi:hypothetical protein
MMRISVAGIRLRSHEERREREVWHSIAALGKGRIGGEAIRVD